MTVLISRLGGVAFRGGGVLIVLGWDLTVVEGVGGGVMVIMGLVFRGCSVYYVTVSLVMVMVAVTTIVMC